VNIAIAVCGRVWPWYLFLREYAIAQWEIISISLLFNTEGVHHTHSPTDVLPSFT